MIEKEKNFLIEVEAPGFNKVDFKLDIDQGILTINAEKQKSDTDEEENYTRREFSCSSFTRVFSLPQNVKESEINAKSADGLLKITLAKQIQGKPAKKKIAVS